MNQIHSFNTHTRSAMAAREILTLKPRTTAIVLSLVLAVVLGVLGGNSSAFAQAQKSTEAAVATSAANVVNINSADAQTLANALKGVGESRAREIVRYRETYGPFASAEELTEVKGIGKSTLDRNRDVITLE